MDRSTKESTDVIFSSLHFLGIDWDEGPYFQSERLDIYHEYAHKLLLSGQAYKCYCSPEEIEDRKRKLKEKGRVFKYDRYCLKLNGEELDKVKDRPFAIRFLVPYEKIYFHDLIRGDITFQGEEIEDFVLLRGDRTPTYNFACVVDDYLLNITHVIRGEDHIPNTPKQVLVYKALGWEVPLLAHLPMILGPDHIKLSKRHGATSVEAYREMGYLPSALANYLALLGASFEPDREVYNMEELIRFFSLDRVSKKAAVFDPEKLKWMNKEHLKIMGEEEIASLLELRGFPGKEYSRAVDRTYLLKVLKLIKERLTLLDDIKKEFSYFFQAPTSYDPIGLENYKNERIRKELNLLVEVLNELEEFTAPFLEDTLRRYAESRDLKARELIHPIRLALTGKTVSPGLFEMMEILGKEETILRIRLFI